MDFEAIKVELEKAWAQIEPILAALYDFIMKIKD